MVSELSRGFRDDCYMYLHEFVKHESIEFKHFCHEWKKMNFQYIFHGRKTDVELIEFVGEALITIKHLFLNTKNPLERVGAFYLLYAVYFKQPMNKFCKIRVTLKDWKEMKSFVEHPHPEKESLQIPVIFWKLFIADAFRFVLNEMEHGYDTFFIKGINYKNGEYNRDSFKVMNQIEEELKTMQSATGIYAALGALEMGYNEMKESFEETETSETSDKIPQTNLMESLKHDISDILNYLNQSNHDQDKDPEFDVANTMDIGDKRSSIRARAFTRKVKRKDFQIASTSDVSPKKERKQPTSRPTKRKDRKTIASSSNLELENDVDMSSDLDDD